MEGSMPRNFSLNFDCGDSAFEDRDEAHEIARILADVRTKVMNGATEGKLHDINGNKIGEWGLTGERYDDKTIVGFVVVNSEGDRVESRVHEDYSDAKRERDEFEEADIDDMAGEEDDPETFRALQKHNDPLYKVRAIDEDDELHDPGDVIEMGDRKSVAA
jgi:hypothetical protein